MDKVLAITAQGMRKKMEYSGKIDFWGLPDDEFMSCENILELVENYLQDMELNEEKAEEEIIIYGYVKKEINKDRLAIWVIDELLERMDDEYTIEEGNKKIAQYESTKRAALRLVDSIIADGYKVETLDKVCEKKIKISDYIEKES